MKVNSRIYLKGLLILFILLTAVLLFPPYTIKNKDYKFFDPIFSSEYVVKKLDKTYSYTLASSMDVYGRLFLRVSRKYPGIIRRRLTEKDTIDAISVLTIDTADTTYNYIQIKELPVREGITTWEDLGLDIPYQFKYRNGRKIPKDPEYYKKVIDAITPYTITEIEKPRYIRGYRVLLLNQLIIEILISVLLCGIIILLLSLISEKM